MSKRPHVVIVGGGFGGLNTAKALRNADLDVTLIDRQNYHLFLPLLYQVAIAGLSPSDIATPLRSIFKRDKNIRTVMGEVTDIDVDQQEVVYQTSDGEKIKRQAYDALVIATGSQYNYFGNDEWKPHAPGMDGLQSALTIRRRVLSAYERAELETDENRQAALMTFAVVGGGPTGVELAGAIAEMANHTLNGDFRVANPAASKVILIEMTDRVLPPFPEDLSAQAQDSLERLGVTVLTKTKVVAIEDEQITVAYEDEREEEIACHTTMWAAGVQASALATMLHERTGVELDRSGRVKVNSDLSLPNYPNVYLAGDMVHFSQEGSPLPGLAPVAMQEGSHVAKQIKRTLLQGKENQPFHYVDRGIMATIGRASAVVDLHFTKLSGLIAWLIWLFIHLMYLVGFRNRMLVFLEWMWNYLTYSRGDRLIINRTNKGGESEEESDVQGA